MSLLALTALLSVISSTVAFDASASNNVAVYWGQGPDQGRLGELCEKSTADIIPLGFLNVFPEQGAGGYPGINFGNACGPGVYKNPEGVETQLLSGCTAIAEDIPKCQALGKKILLSLGGATPETYRVSSDEAGAQFADFLWGAFGPAHSSYSGPRPFGDAVVDGFDFDIEHNGSGGYAALITRLREHYEEDSSKQYYISAAPQCVLPDKQLSDVISKAWFDFVWIQFFNTPGCSARDYVDGRGKFTFDDWVGVVQASPNAKAKVMLGLPASQDAVYKPEFYLEPHEVTKIVTDFKGKYPEQFGGVMLWEAAASETNRVNGKSFCDAVKDILGGTGQGSTDGEPTPKRRIPTPEAGPNYDYPRQHQRSYRHGRPRRSNPGYTEIKAGPVDKTDGSDSGSGYWTDGGRWRKGGRPVP
ncbi:MAG: hypothetical protein M1815_005700 [Lichina confinis]|nr:MAG: hypothetical protein M1815_005700 [Lichina confinis]